MSNFVHIQDGSADALMENDSGKRHIDMQLLWYININEDTFIREKKKEDNSKDKQWQKHQRRKKIKKHILDMDYKNVT